MKKLILLLAASLILPAAPFRARAEGISVVVSGKAQDAAETYKANGKLYLDTKSVGALYGGQIYWYPVSGRVHVSPQTAVYVVEPEGADTLSRSFKAGSPQSIEAVRTIADSLGAPRCEPYSFALNRRFVDEVVLVNDDQIREAMRLLFRAAKLAVEPAGAAALAALMHPLRARLEGKSVGIVVCGANIDPETFAKQITQM